MIIETDLEKHFADLRLMIKATAELYYKDKEQKLIIQQVYVDRGAPRWDKRATLSIALKKGPEMTSCISFGIQTAYFLPQGETFTGSMPKPDAVPPTWIKLPNKITETDSEGVYEIDEPRGNVQNVIFQNGTLVIQPNTSTVLLGRWLRHLQENPGEYPLHLAQNALYYEEAMIKEPEQIVWPLGNEDQRQAVSHCASNAITYLWGPPGTGKSTVITKIIEYCLEKGLKVFVGSQTNNAIDAVAQKLQHISKKDPDSLIGRAVGKDLITRYGNSLGGYSLGRILIDGRKAKGANREFLVKQAMERDKVSISTIFRFMAAEMKNAHYDVVILDEVGAIGTPFVYWMAATAHQKIVLVGDQKQLPPVLAYKALSENTKRWFEQSIFVEADLGTNGDDRRLLLLSYQYRMRERLAQVVRMTGLYPRYKTPDGDKEISSIGEAALSIPIRENEEFTLIDTSDMEGSFSGNQNTHHFEIGKAIIQMAWDKKIKPSVIAPYQNQVKLYQNWFFDENKRKQEAQFGTVHAFQGSEGPLVILDLVEGYELNGVRSRCFFTDELKNPIAIQLLNVAVSRAQYKLVVIGNAKFILKEFKPENFLHKLITQAKEKGEWLPSSEIPLLEARELGTKETSDYDVFPKLFEGGNIQNVFYEDLKKSKTKVEFFAKDMEEGFMVGILGMLAKTGIACTIYTGKKNEELVKSKGVQVKESKEWRYSGFEVVFDSILGYAGCENLLQGMVNPTVLRKLVLN